MKNIILFGMTSLLSINLYAQSIFYEKSPMDSSYVASKVCDKLNRKYGTVFSDDYFQNIFNDKNKMRSTKELSAMFLNENGIELISNEKMNALKLARCKRQIDDVVFSLIQKQIQMEDKIYNENEEIYQENPTLLKMEVYVVKKTAIQSKLVGLEKLTKNPFPLDKFPMKLNGMEEITVKERIYTLYSEGQMNRMAKTISYMLSIMDAEKVETKIKLRDEEEPIVIEHTPADIYRLALRVFNMERKKLIAESRGQQLPFAPIDFIASAYELKTIPAEVVTLLTQDESFYVKEKSMAKKLGSYLVKLGITTAQINPISAPYALIGIMLYNTYTEINNIKDRVEVENFYFN